VLDILKVTLPFFALILLGFLVTKRKIVPTAAIPGLNAFVLYVALPCMLYEFGATTPIMRLLDAGVLMVYLPCALLMVGFAISMAKARQINWNNASMGALVAAFPNTGFMGIPLLVALLGVSAAGPAIITIVIDLVITTSLCIALSRLDGFGQDGTWSAVKRAARSVVLNPLPWAILIGAINSALGYELQGLVHDSVSLLGEAASPVALFTIGAVLARAQILGRYPTQDVPSTMQKPTFGLLRSDPLLLALLKLFLHPILIFVFGSLARSLGAPLSLPALTVIVLVAALPSASNVSLLAERFGANTDRIAKVILFSTTISFFTFPLAVQWLK
jgi:malonate transporter and related proteins